MTFIHVFLKQVQKTTYFMPISDLANILSYSNRFFTKDGYMYIERLIRIAEVNLSLKRMILAQVRGGIRGNGAERIGNHTNVGVAGRGGLLEKEEEEEESPEFVEQLWAYFDAQDAEEREEMERRGNGPLARALAELEENSEEEEDTGDQVQKWLEGVGASL